MYQHAYARESLVHVRGREACTCKKDDLSTARVSCTVTGYHVHAVKGMRAGKACGEVSARIEVVCQMCARASGCARASKCARASNAM